MEFKIIRRKKRTPTPAPTRDEISTAVNDFLRNGGRITQIEPSERTDFDMIPIVPGDPLVDDFLMGV